MLEGGGRVVSAALVHHCAGGALAGDADLLGWTKFLIPRDWFIFLCRRE